MVKLQEARVALHIIAVLMAVTAAVATAALHNSGSDHHVLGFVGPSIAPGSIATRFDAAAAAGKKCGLAKAPAAAAQQSTSNAESPLARRILLRKARASARPTTRPATADAPQRQQRREVEERTERGVGDVGDLFRMEVAQRMKEVKLMMQPGVGLLPPAGSPSNPSVLAAPKLDGDAAALESQISLLTNRIESIANHLQATPTDAVSRKGLVVLVKRRRCLLETLRHRDNSRWLATTESLGLRQRSDAASVAGEQLMMAARRARRRDRGRRRRQDDNSRGAGQR